VSFVDQFALISNCKISRIFYILIPPQMRKFSPEVCQDLLSVRGDLK